MPQTREQVVAAYQALVDQAQADLLVKVTALRAQMKEAEEGFVGGVPPKIAKAGVFIDNAIHQLTPPAPTA